MAEWSVRKLQLPPGLETAVEKGGDVAGKVADFLAKVHKALDVASVFATGGFDLYRTLVSVFITGVENMLSDLQNAGVYVLVDYPQSLNAAQFNPVAEASLAGTILDKDAMGVLSGEDAGTKAGFDKLQAISGRRTQWNPPSPDIMSYDVAIERVAGAFVDPLDPLRPMFSPSAHTVGVVIMVHSEELGTFLKLVRAIDNLFALDDLRQSVILPGFKAWFEGLSKDFSELSQTELDELDLAPPVKFRNAGAPPNFIMQAKLVELVPVLGDALTELAALVEQFRPNGELTDFVKEVLTALANKIERIRQIAVQLKTLSEGLKSSFSGTELATCVIKSTTGDDGFRLGLLNSTGHPEFNHSLVCTVLLYAGGPSADVLAALFGAPGQAIVSSKLAAIENEKRHLDRPVLTP